MLKKTISVLVALFFVANMTFASFATQKAELLLNNDLAGVQGVLNSWLTSEGSSISRNSIQLGNKIPAYKYTNSQLVELDQTRYYPVYSNNQVIGFVGIHGSQSNPTYSFSQDWASTMNDYISQGKSEFCIVATDTQLYFKTVNSAKLVEEYKFAKSGLSKRSFVNENILSVLNDGEVDYYAPQNKYRIDMPIQTRAAYTVSLRIGTYKQTNGECWAATVMLIGKYMTKNSSYTPLEICDEMGIDKDVGAYDEDVQKALSKLYNVPSIIQGRIAHTTVQTLLDNKKPCGINWQSPKFGHYTAVDGYSTDTMSNKYGVRISDSNSGTYKWLYKTGNPSSGLDYVYTWGSQVYSWTNTITLK